MSHMHGTDLGGVNSVERLRERCYIDPLNGCWHWRQSFSNGLPRVSVKCPETGERKNMRGRRAALTLKGGKLLKSGWLAYRSASCESSDCVNPDHSFAGPPRAAGKAVTALGIWKEQPNRIAANTKINRSKRKLTPEQVAMALESPLSDCELGRQLNVSSTTINALRRGRTYRNTMRGASVFQLGAV